MEEHNITTILLLGFPDFRSFRIVFFLFLFMTYLITVCGNLLVIILVSSSRNLHSPMYFFLTQLTTSDIILTSDIVPNMLHIVLSNGSFMSLPGCLTQLFFFGSSESSECLLLTVMSYDRYLAICHPLHYDLLMNLRLCMRYIFLSWLTGFTVTLVQTVNVSRLHFCHSNIIDHFFCDFDPLLQLSCSTIIKIKLLSIFIGFPIIVCPFIIVVISYVYIIHAVLKIRSIIGRQKAFSTCGSHLAVVSIFYGTLFSIYLIPQKGNSMVLCKFFSIVYTVVTPLVNPIIYSLRNEDIKKAFKKIKVCLYSSK